MDVSELQSKIEKFERQVMWRRRMLALQDRVAIALLAGGVASAALVLYARLRPLQLSVWVIAGATLAIALLIAAAIWHFNRAGRREAAFLIDSSLELEDRAATSRAIIERGGPRNEFEEALIEDTASRIAGCTPAEVVPYRASRQSLLSVVGMAALVAALMVPQKVLPMNEDAMAARADIQAAGEILETSAARIEQIIPPETETAQLAKEQAELGRALRVSPESRAEALKMLSALEEKIRRRHDEIAATRADEIVSLAEQRLSNVLAPKPSNRKSEASPGESGQLKEGAATENNEATKAQDKSSSRDAQGRSKTNAQRGAASNNQQPSSNQTANKTEQKQSGQPSNKSQEQVSSQSQQAAAQTNQAAGQPSANQQATERSAQQAAQSGQAPQQQQSAENNPGNQQQPGQASPDQQQPDQQSPGQQPNPLTGAMAEQAAKALPSMSGELMKKAAELRVGQLSPEDVKSLANAAQFLANDLSKMAASPEFRAAAEQLAKQVTPEMIEQFARELAKNEQLMRELQATAQMIMENQQARQAIAGIANQLEKIGTEMRDQSEREGRISPLDNQKNRRGQRPGRGASGQTGQTDESGKLAGQVKEVNLSGKLQRKDGGEYLYLPSKAGAGAARAPYSSAYPQYRREAERTVERSQIPPHMRTTVRRYFDAINPDGKKQ